MNSQEILSRYLEFFKKRGHKEIPNHSLIPDNDPTLLFVNSGMFPLVPYFSGETHPMGKKLVNIQRALRFEDLEEVGDKRHTTCFHMLGNWSLGDYFKLDQLNWIYEFLIEDLNLNPTKLYATVFSGNKYSPKDTESINILKNIFQKYGIVEIKNKIFLTKDYANWWQRGDAVGELGGPDSEIFYYLGEIDSPLDNPTNNENDYLEIGNSVFMQYTKTKSGWQELPQKNVDFGGGLERIALVVQNKTDIFETDNFWPIIQKIEEISRHKYLENPETTRIMRILADHIRTATFIAMDGIAPSNKDQGYVLRRFLRRLIRFAKKIGIENNVSKNLLPVICKNFDWLYPELKTKQTEIANIFTEEEIRFSQTLKNAEKEVSKQLKNTQKINPKEAGAMAFAIFQSTGFPEEMFLDELKERGLFKAKNFAKDFIKEFQKRKQKHQKESRVGTGQKFKGGLADQSETVTKYHTTTHILHQALRKTLGIEVLQSGSNITGERLRFDFSYSKALTPNEVKQVEKEINDTIRLGLPVNFITLPKTEAEKTNALHLFKEKYPELVKVYFIGKTLEKAYSKEFCGGPHVKNLSELKPTLTIYKQENLGKGIRRIYAKFKS